MDEFVSAVEGVGNGPTGFRCPCTQQSDDSFSNLIGPTQAWSSLFLGWTQYEYHL